MVAQYLFCIFGFVVDGILAAIFPINFMNNSMYFVPCFGFCAIVMAIRRMSLTDGMIMAILMGMFYDFVYADAYLFYAVIFALLCLVVKTWTKHLGYSLPETIVICTAAIFMKELIVFIYLKTAGLTQIDVGNWLGNRIFLTIIVNAILVCALYLINSLKERIVINREVRQRREEKIFIYRDMKK